MGQKVIKAIKGMLELKDRKEIKAIKGILEPRGRKVIRAIKVILELKDRKEKRVTRWEMKRLIHKNRNRIRLHLVHQIPPVFRKINFVLKVNVSGE